MARSKPTKPKRGGPQMGIGDFMQEQFDANRGSGGGAGSRPSKPATPAKPKPAKPRGKSARR